jgi:hyperosmotically inducible periplasmic protein
MRVQTLSRAAMAAVIATTLGLAACDRAQDDRSVGQKIDSAVAKVEKKSDQAVAEAKKEMADVRASASQTVDAAGGKVKDAAITTSINAELTKDAALSALKINVDTSQGRVALRGTAPSAAARDRATLLAKRVEGVVSVENQLQVRTN